MAPLVVRASRAFRERAPRLREAFLAQHRGNEVVGLPPSLPRTPVQPVLVGALADVVRSANREDPTMLAEVGYAEPPMTIAGSRVVLVVRTGLGDRRGSLTKPLRPGLRLPLSQPVTGPCGRYAHEAFAGAGRRREFGEKGRRGGPAFRRSSIALVAADAAVRSASLASLPRSPAFDLADRIAFSAAVLTRTDERPVAEAFLAFSCGRSARALLREAGFSSLEREEERAHGTGV
ncbi:MAG: substrate-binding domain-containing protein [Thermomicrobium sp.]|nr:substrate-binding domain-containing protein [Thermomicrobium sp.]